MMPERGRAAIRQGLRLLRRLVAEAEKAASYGLRAPRLDEVVPVEVAAVRRAVPTPFDAVPPARNEPTALRIERIALEQSYRAARDAVGRVIGDTRFGLVRPLPIEALFKMECCRRHWAEGVPWVETGIYEVMLLKIERAGHVSGCRSLDDLRRRYAALDRIFERVARERRLAPPGALGPRWARDGIEIHLGPGGEPIFGGCGTHRMAMARVLDLARVPAVLGFVHRDALEALAALRAERDGHTAPARVTGDRRT